MTDNAKIILAELKRQYPTEMTKQDLAANLLENGISMPAVTGTVNGQVKKGYAVERVDEVEVDCKAKSFRYVVLTNVGLSYDPDEEESALKSEKEADKSAKAAAKAAANEAKE